MLSVVAGNESYTGLLNSNLLPCSWDIAYIGMRSSAVGRQLYLLCRKRNRLDIIPTYRSWTTGSNNFYPAFERGRRKKKNQSLYVHRHVHLATLQFVPNARVIEMNNNAADIRYYTDGKQSEGKRRPLKLDCVSTTG